MQLLITNVTNDIMRWKHINNILKFIPSYSVPFDLKLYEIL